MEPITFYIKRGPFSDETSLYGVVMNKEMTVSDLIDYAIGRNCPSFDWGYISIIGNNDHYKPIYRLEYGKGKVISDTIPEEIKAAKIKDMDAYGGWSRLDYNIEIEAQKTMTGLTDFELAMAQYIWPGCDVGPMMERSEECRNITKIEAKEILDLAKKELLKGMMEVEVEVVPKLGYYTLSSAELGKKLKEMEIKDKCTMKLIVIP